MANQGPLILALAEAFGTASAVAGGKPTDSRKNARFLGPIEVEIERSEAGNAALPNVGGGTIWGVNLPSIQGNSGCQQFLGVDGATGRTVFDVSTDFATYAAFANYNWIVIQNGVVLEQGAGAGKYQVSNPAGSTARITLGTAAAVGDILEVYKVTPVSLLTFADAALSHKQAVLDAGKELMWYVTDATANPAVTNVYVWPVGE